MPTLVTCPRVGPKAPANPKLTGVGKRGGGGAAPPGAWGMCPQNKKRGRVVHISEPATSGAQNAGRPSAHEGGQTGGPGGEAPWQGVWGMCPHKTLKGDKLATLATPPRVGPKTLANLWPTRAGKRGSRGRKPHGGGSWGVSPTKPKLVDKQPTLATPPTSGAQNAGEPSAHEGGKTEVQGGEAPMAGGVSPHKIKRGASCPH